MKKKIPPVFLLLALLLGIASSGDRVPPVFADRFTPTVVGWGMSGHGQSSVPPGLSGVVAFSAGGYHSLALKSDGTVVAWGCGGGKDFGQCTVPADLTGVTAISAGYYHNLALKSDGTVVAWGDNSYGQTSVPADLTGVIAISAGGYHSLAFKSDGTIVAWGLLGQANIPAGLSGVTAISAGGAHNLALKSDGTVVAWGCSAGNEFYQCNVPTDLTGVIAIAAGWYFSMALKNDGTVIVWGGWGRDVTPPPGLNNVTAIAAGGAHALALKNDGTVVAWGDNGFQQSIVPAGLSSATAISAGFIHSLAFGLLNHEPVAQNQSVTTNRETAVDITLAATDADSDSLTYNIVAGPSHGTLSGSAPLVTYTPAENYVGRDSFTYNASDGELVSNVAQVSIAIVANAAPAQVVIPVPGGPLTVNTAVVNDSPGGQTDPHVSGDWVSYTDNSVYSIRFQNLDLGIASERLVPHPDGQYDSLSDISGTNIVFMRASAVGSQGIYLVQIDASGSPGSAIEVSPSETAQRRRSVIGGDTIAYEDRGYEPSSPAQPEIALSSVLNPAAPAYRLTNDTFADQWPAVSPDGDAVVWVKCASAAVCDVWRVERTMGVWGTPEPVSVGEDTDSLPDTDGPVTVYGSTAGGDDNIHWSVKDSSGAYVESVLALPGVQRNPNISGNFIAFESSATIGTQFDIYLFDLATNILYKLTNTPVSESLSDITTNAFGAVRVAWAQPKQVYPFDMDVYALSAVLPPPDDNTAPTASPGGPYLGAVNTSIAFDGSLSSDSENDPLTYAWTFGDGATGTESAPTHSYTAAGIYNVCLTVSDGSLDSDPACTMAVVYDPSAGFVTGGGWINSPAGAYKADETLAGKATFGFVSKYQKGTNVPTGNTAFEFDLAGLAFSSQSYEWLVVNRIGMNAQFKGTGLINGEADPNGNTYKFMLWAGDGPPDTFRIRIWWEDAAGEHDVYDNGTTQAIGAGNIVVHTGK